MHNKIGPLGEKLPYPTRIESTSFGPVEVYEIPAEDKAKILKMLYPFRPFPRLEDKVEDIHAEKIFTIKDFIVTREGRMNILASPFYLESGGTVMDWFPVD